MSKKAESRFERHEKKYVLSKEQANLALAALLNHMCVDEYDKHTILSLYFDTDDYTLIHKSIQKPAYKEKLRLRSYGVPGIGDTVFLELKKKFNKVTYKRRMPLHYKKPGDYLLHDDPPAGGEDRQVREEIDYFFSVYRPEPKALVIVDRIAMFGKEDSELRITIDSDIRFRLDDLDPANGDHGTLLLPNGESVMEIKCIGNMPFWLTRLLSDNRIYPGSFSKYGTVYREHILPGIAPSAFHPLAVSA